MKSELVSEPAGTAPANTVATVASERLAAAEGDDAESREWKETPTEANRARTLAAEATASAPATVGPGGAGAYRMLRPSVADVLEAQSVARSDAPSVAKRVVIGAARIRR